MQKSEYCVLCKGKLDTHLTTQPYTSEGFAHISCIEDKFCVFCGISGLCIRCSHRDCIRTFHYHCSLQHLTKDCQDTYCDLHRKPKSKRKEYQKLWLARQIGNKLNQNPDLIRKIKLEHSDAKSSSFCTGQVFWFSLNSQYFPSFVSLSKPIIPVQYNPSPLDPSAQALDSQIAALESDLLMVQGQNSEILDSVMLKPYTDFKDLKEDELILAETRNLSLKEGFDDYLRYFESKVRIESDPCGGAEKRSSGLREVIKDEEDYICSICNDGDYEDDDLIVICSVCEMGAHMKCYGILVVPEDDWVCHGCRCYSLDQRNSIKCALCPVKGGCVKPTIHTVTELVNFPNYQEINAELVWVHVFCVVHLESDAFTDPERLEGIDLSKIDPERFELKCFICKTKDGACLQCQFGRCQVAFHPECGKDLFTNTRDEVSYYCPMHKPLKLRKILETKEKKCVDDVLCFTKCFDRLDKRAKTPSQVQPIKRPPDRPFTCTEKLKLIKLLESEVLKVSENNKKEFNLYLKLSSGSLRHKIQVSRPETFNILDPQAIIQKKLTIKGRKPAECQKIYSDQIYPIMKKELEILKLNTVKYCPKGKKVNGIIKKTLEKRVLNVETPKKDVVYVQQKIDSVFVADVVTKEVYCICRKPFVEKSVKKFWESEIDFIKRTEESKMVQCDKCDEWYHYKCVGVVGEDVEDGYVCKACEGVAWKE